MALYEFIDTTESPKEAGLPAEAMMWNGEFIENKIEGYRTLYVKGREALSPEITTYTTGVRDGSVMQARRLPARTITVGYQLVAKDDAAFRAAFTRLNYILSDVEAQIIFNDEDDRYFTGTVSKHATNYDAGTNKITSEFEITCADPYKYSTYTVDVPVQEDGTFVFGYAGTAPAHPILEADFYEENDSDGTLTGYGDCGYVAWFDSDEHIIMLGDADEKDTETYSKSQTLFNQNWKSETSLSAAWERNKGTLSSGINNTNGSVEIGNYSNLDSDGNCIRVKDYGSASSSESSDSSYHGTSVYREIPADASGEVGATDWTLSWGLKISIGTGTDANKERGDFEMLVRSTKGNIIAGMHIFKGTTATTATMRMFVRSTTVKDVTIDLTYHNTRFGSNTTDGTITTVKTCTITKSGTTVTFNLGGSTYSFTDSALSGSGYSTAEYIVFFFGQKYDYPTLTRNYVRSCKFVKNNCTTWTDIPNKFSANDVVKADCNTGIITLNDSPSPEYGALGNDWETFLIQPGRNQIGTSYSDWTSKAPTFKLSYREVYL